MMMRDAIPIGVASFFVSLDDRFSVGDMFMQK